MLEIWLLPRPPEGPGSSDLLCVEFILFYFCIGAKLIFSPVQCQLTLHRSKRSLAILSTGFWTSGATGAALTSLAFEVSLPGFGGPIIAISLAIFAFTTIKGWSYYSERSLQYLFGTKIIMPFRAVWSLAVIGGATMNLTFVWLVADTLNAMMAIPNLIALVILSPIVFSITREFFDIRGKSEDNPF